MNNTENNHSSATLSPNRSFQNLSYVPWRPFEPAPNAPVIAADLRIIPKHLALTTLQGKAPKRKNWESETPLSRDYIESCILYGEEKISKKGNQFRLYASGYGIRTGAASGGIVAIDVDGHQAHELLQHISAGDLPKTVSFTSGKQGRYQLLFQVPAHVQPALANFTRKPIREWGEFKSGCDLDFRYNEMQSCLPPSLHPDTGSYKYINSFGDTPIAEAPEWLCNLLLSLADKEKQEKAESERARLEREERRRQRRLNGFIGSGNLIDLVEQAGERLGLDIYNWPEHNFRKAGRKLVGHCPQHGGESGTAFQINPSDWSWYCHGCGVGGHAIQYRYFAKGYKGTPKGKEFFAIAHELIEDAGLSLPEFERYTVEPVKDRTISRDQWLNQHKRPESEHEITGWLKGLLRRHRRFLSSPSAGPKTLPPIAQPEITGGLLPYGVRLDATGKRSFRYEKGNLPTRERWIWLNRPDIECLPELVQVMVAEGLEKGWKNFHDKSGTGSGKSYLWGDINLGLLPRIDQVIMTTGSPDNPTTLTVENNYVRLPARHNGLVLDHTHTTPGGKPHRRRAKAGETPDIPGNCPETNTFRKLEELGLIVRGGKDSAVCESCPLFGAGCEFIPERRLILERETIIIAHLDQVPEKFKKDWNVLGVHDEPGQTIKTTKTIRFSWESLRRGLEKIRSLDPELHSLLFHFYTAWQTAIPAKIHQRFGLNFIELVEALLPMPRFIAGNGQTIEIVQAAEQADKLLNPQISLSGIQTPSEKQSWVEDNIHSHYFTLLFKALTDADKRSSVTLDHNWNFTVTLRNYHYQRVAEGMAGNVWLDATLSTGDLALKIGAKTDDFLPYKMVAEDTPAEAKPNKNLTFKVINRIGKCGRDRQNGSPFGQVERLENLDKAIDLQIKQQNPDAKIAGIDHKVHATKKGQGYWHKDSRGSNAYQDADHLKLYGLPMKNLGAMAAEYQALTGNAVRPDDLTGGKGDWIHPWRLVTHKTKTGHSKNYGHWVRRQVVAEVIQAAGRLRPNRTDKPKTVWLISDDYDASIVAELQHAFPGCTVEVMAAADICVEAAPKGEQRVMSVVEATWELVKAGAKVTTSTVAKAVTLHRTRVSQIASDFGGFEHLTGVLNSLYKALLGKLTPSELSKEAWFVAHTWLPDIAAQIEAGEEIDLIAELATIREGFGTRTYLAILAGTPPRALGKLLKWALCHLPPAILRDIGEAEPIRT